MIRILVADDHIVVRRGLRMILLEGFPGAHIEEVGDAEDLIKQVMKADWEVAVMRHPILADPSRE